jgi:hypothetical protein
MKYQNAESQKDADLCNEEQEARMHERQEVIRLGHGSGDQALQQFFPACVHDSKSHSPDRAAHQVHSQQAGCQEIDLARARFADQYVGGRNWIAAVGGLLNGAIRKQAGGAALGICVVILIDDRAAGAGLHAC